jgi:hypothetical protein
MNQWHGFTKCTSTNITGLNATYYNEPLYRRRPLPGLPYAARSGSKSIPNQWLRNRQPDLLRPETWTSAASPISRPTISAVTPNAISLPASASGLTLSGSLAGPMTEPSGPAPVPANLSPRQAQALGLMTSGTFGPLGTISSRAADLQSSLANRLRARTDIFGSTLFKLTWKVQRTPAGRSFSLLRALAHRTAVTESSTWPTPRAEDSESSGARLSRGVNDTLTAVSRLASWPTPMAGTPAQKGYNEAGNNDSSRQTVALAGWATPLAHEARLGYQRRDTGKKGSQESLTTEVINAVGNRPHLSPWPTPQVDSFRSRSGDRKGEMGLDQLARTIPTPPLLASGSAPTGFLPRRTVAAS